MEFEKLINKEKFIQEAAILIFETDIGLFTLLFGNKDKAIPRIKKLIEKENNSFSKNHIYIAHEKDQLLGLILSYKGGSIDRGKEENEIYSSLGLLITLKLAILEKLILNNLLTKSCKLTDYYISNICVFKKFRGKGIGTFLLDNIFTIAKNENCEKIILDVSDENTNAFTFYKKKGFEIVKENSFKILPIKHKTYTMKYSLF